MQHRGRRENHTAVDDAHLHAEHVQRNPGEHDRALAGGLRRLLNQAALHDPVHRVENHRDRKIQRSQQYRKPSVVRICIGKRPGMVVQAVAQAKSQLLGKNIPQNEIQVLCPALAAALIHGCLTSLRLVKQKNYTMPAPFWQISRSQNGERRLPPPFSIPKSFEEINAFSPAL